MFPKTRDHIIHCTCSIALNWQMVWFAGIWSSEIPVNKNWSELEPVLQSRILTLQLFPVFLTWETTHSQHSHPFLALWPLQGGTWSYGSFATRLDGESEWELVCIILCMKTCTVMLYCVLYIYIYIWEASALSAHKSRKKCYVLSIFWHVCPSL